MTKITKVNIIAPFMRDSGETATAFIPQPNEIEVRAISRVLAHFYEEGTKKGSKVQILVVDWERLIEESLSDIEDEKAQDIKAKIDTFLERQLISAKYFTDLEEFDFTKLSEEEKNILKGQILFLCALSRYVSKGILLSEVKDFFTSLDYTEFRTSSGTSQEKQVEGKTKKKKLLVNG